MGWLEDDAAIVTGAGSGSAARWSTASSRRAPGSSPSTGPPTGWPTVEAEHGDAVAGVVGDVTTPPTTHRAVEEALARFGRLDTFVANAGHVRLRRRAAGHPGRGARARPSTSCSRSTSRLPARARRRRGRRLAESRGSLLDDRLDVLAPMPASAAGLHRVEARGRRAGPPARPRARARRPGQRRRPGLHGAPTSAVRGRWGWSSRRRPRCPGSSRSPRPPRRWLPATTRDYTGHYVQLASRANAAATTGVVIACDGGLDVRGIGLPAGP